ncbi:MAG TPA: adenosylcobinamide-GDP ribazoletransferase [Acidimicrobiales bacterium]|nr:adenosylcobinamide-GDP ribazoletransferase [Acidimicrobiales bacterium]
MYEAVSFLTAVGGARRPGPRALPWFPAVGAGLGLILGGAWWVAGRWWPAAVAAALVVAADLGVTGLLHLDGLVDASDGLLPHLTRQRRLEVMRRPDAGAFGVGVAVVVLLARWAAIASLRPAPLLLGALWCVSRSAMAVTVARVPYARDVGLASAFRPGGRRGTVIIGAGAVAASAGVAAVWSVPAGPAAVAAAAVGFGAVVALAWRRVGGFTGDVLGAAGLLAETVGLITAAARW